MSLILLSQRFPLSLQLEEIYDIIPLFRMESEENKTLFYT